MSLPNLPPTDYERRSVRPIVRTETHHNPKYSSNDTKYGTHTQGTISFDDDWVKNVVIGYIEVERGQAIPNYKSFEKLYKKLEKHKLYIQWFKDRMNDEEKEIVGLD